MLEVLQLGWLFGISLSLGLLGYGGWLVWVFQAGASTENQHAVARLALHDARPLDALLPEMKIAALVLRKA